MKKILCIVSNIVLSSLYISTSWMLSAAALFYLIGINWNLSSLPELFWVAAIVLIVFTPAYCLLGIILSVRQWLKKRYLSAFLVQFLPFGTIGLSIVLFLIPVWLQIFI